MGSLWQSPLRAMHRCRTEADLSLHLREHSLKLKAEIAEDERIAAEAKAKADKEAAEAKAAEAKAAEDARRAAEEKEKAEKAVAKAKADCETNTKAKQM